MKGKGKGKVGVRDGPYGGGKGDAATLSYAGPMTPTFSPATLPVRLPAAVRDALCLVQAGLLPPPPAPEVAARSSVSEYKEELTKHPAVVIGSMMFASLVPIDFE